MQPFAAFIRPLRPSRRRLPRTGPLGEYTRRLARPAERRQHIHEEPLPSRKKEAPSTRTRGTGEDGGAGDRHEPLRPQDMPQRWRDDRGRQAGRGTAGQTARAPHDLLNHSARRAGRSKHRQTKDI